MCCGSRKGRLHLLFHGLKKIQPQAYYDFCETEVKAQPQRLMLLIEIGKVDQEHHIKRKNGTESPCEKHEVCNA